VEDLKAAVEALQRAREAKLAEVRSIDQALEALGAPVEGRSQPRIGGNDFQDMGITAATKRYLKQEGEPRSTREILNALLQGGVRTRSDKPVAAVYATLRNSEAFRRTGDGRWELAVPGE
jgi:hypothetical protein